MGRQIGSKIGTGAAGSGIRGNSRITSKGLGCANNSLIINQVLYQGSLVFPPSILPPELLYHQTISSLVQEFPESASQVIPSE